MASSRASAGVAVLGFIGIPFLVLLALAVDQWLLIEYRQWVADHQTLAGTAKFWFTQAFSPGAVLPRATGLGTAFLFGSLCGTALSCHNTLNIALMAFAALGVFAFGSLLTNGRRCSLSAFCAGLYLLSVPMLDGAAWQATILDRVSAVGVAVGLVTMALTLRLPEGRRQSVVSNIAIFFVCVLFYNAKEAAWFLLPSLALLVVAERDGSAEQTWKHWMISSLAACMRLLALPMLYVGYRVGVHLVSLWMDGSAIRHAFGGGNRISNGGYFILLALNSISTNRKVTNVVSPLLFLLLIFATLVSIWWVVRKSSHSGVSWGGLWTRYQKLFLWASVTYLIGVFIPSGTLYAAPFYLIAPGIGLALVVFFAVLAVEEELRAPWGKTALPIFCVALGVSHTIGFFQCNKRDYVSIWEWSRNARAALMLAVNNAEPGLPVHVLYSHQVFRGFMHFEHSDNPKLGWLLISDAGRAKDFDATFTSKSFEGDFVSHMKDGALNIVLDNKLALITMIRK